MPKRESGEDTLQMNSDPLVVCVCLTADRQAMTERAVSSFASQTYKNKFLVIFDTGVTPFKLPTSDREPSIYGKVALVKADHDPKDRIGKLRNMVNGAIRCELIAHWDSDDWSHSSRLTEQVKALTPELDAVGYNEVLFWREPRIVFEATGIESAGIAIGKPAEAWLYSNSDPRYAIGSSLLYRRATWEQHPFKDDFPAPNGTGEDHNWIQGIAIKAVSSFRDKQGPKMICSIHAGNTSTGYEAIDQPGQTSWKRSPEYDDLCRRTMTL